MKKITAILWTCAVCAATLICAPGLPAQDTGGTVDLQFASSETKLIGPSPEASAMTRYADTPVSWSLGQAEIALPLYEIRSRSLGLPLSLSYNSSGVRVDEVSGLTGLNWTLSAGGVITRTVVGLPDESLQGWKDTEGIYSQDPLVLDTYGCEQFSDIASGERDSGRDLYSYSFAGRGGSFFLRRKAGGYEAVPTSATDLTIAYEGDTFRITAPDGSVWIFAEKEITSNSVSPILTPIGWGSGNSLMANQYASPVTAWYLTRVESMDGLDAIIITYQTLTTMKTEHLSWFRNYSFTYSAQIQAGYIWFGSGWTWNAYPPVQYDSGAYRTIRWWTPHVVSRIDWAGGSARFTYRTSDIPGDIRRSYPDVLDRLEVYAVPSGQSGSGTLVRRCDFTMGSTQDGRQLLKGLSITGRDGSAVETYSFSYIKEETNMGRYAKDIFGYYNGADGNQDPSFLRLFDDMYAFNEPVADRSYNAVAVSDLTLESIVTGSGSKTVFSYEGSTISLSGASDLWTSVGIGHRLRKIATYDLSGGSESLVRERTFSYGVPHLTIPVDAFRRSSFFSVSETFVAPYNPPADGYGLTPLCRMAVVSFSDQSILPGASPESARIVYGEVTETVSDPTSGEQYRTEYTYDVSEATYANSGGTWSLSSAHDSHDEHFMTGGYHFFQRPPSQVPRQSAPSSVDITPRWNHYIPKDFPQLSVPVRVRRYKHSGGQDILVSQTDNAFRTVEATLRTGLHVRNMIAAGEESEMRDTTCAIDFFYEELKQQLVWYRLERTTETEWLDDGTQKTSETVYLYDKGVRTSPSQAVSYPGPSSPAPGSPAPAFPPMGSILSPRLVTRSFDGDPSRTYSRYTVFPDELSGLSGCGWADELLSRGYRQGIGEEVLVGGGTLLSGHVYLTGTPSSKSGRYVTWDSFTPSDTGSGSLLRPSAVEVWRQEPGSGTAYERVGPTLRYPAYDHWGNPLEEDRLDPKNPQDRQAVSYLWSYDGLRPVAEIAGVGYAQLRSMVGGATLDAMASASAGPSVEQFAQVRTGTGYTPTLCSLYRYDGPMYAMSESEDPSGRKTSYIYDGAGRLAGIKDEDGNLTEGYLYELTRGGNGSPNRITTLRYTAEDVTAVPSSFSGAMTTLDAVKEVTYLDGLGRRLQGVSVGAATGGKDLVTPFAPDFLDREDVREYLPYPAATSATNMGAWRGGALAAQQSWYTGRYGSAEGTRAYAGKVYERSARGRVTATSLPGFTEQTLLSTAGSPADYIPVLVFDPGTQTLTSDGYYPQGRFTVSAVAGPDGSLGETWTDEFGTPVLERVRIRAADAEAGTPEQWAETRYVKDGRGRVLCVIPPAEYAQLLTVAADNSGIVPSFSAEHCYTYGYDGRDRVVAQHLPDQAGQRLSYNNADLVTRSVRTAALGGDVTGTEIHSTEYDGFNRPVRETFQHVRTEPEGWDYAITEGPVVTMSEYAYDDYPASVGTGSAARPVPSFSAAGGVATGQDRDGRTRGLKTAEVVRILDPDEGPGTMSSDADASFIARAFYYDAKGNVIQTAQSRPDVGTTLRSSLRYGFAGEVVGTEETLQLPSGGKGVPLPYRLSGSRTYDAHLRLTGQTAMLSQGAIASQASLGYSYDDLGRTARLVCGSGSAADTTAYAYTLQGWLSEASSPTYGEVLRYASPSRAATSALPGKAGLVTEWTSWQKGSLSSGAAPQSETCAFAYDGAGRLTGSTRYAGSSASPLSTLTEKDITYDESGSLLSLRRYGSTSGTVSEDSLSFTYAGTRRSGYGYDAYGNVTDDPVSGTTIRWNVIGLPRRISDATEMTRRVYAADGTLLAVYEGGTGTKGRVYEGSLVLSRSAAGVLSVESAGWEGGRILPGTGADKHLYQITDHLGSVRAVRDGEGTVLQRLDYYPFGSVSRSWRADEVLEAADPVEPGPVGDILPDASPAGAPEGQLGDAIPVVDVIPVSVTVAGSAQRYRFSGKEIAGPGMGVAAPAGTAAATAAATPYLNFGARLYDPRTASWLSQDPMAEKYYSISPYAYCHNDPINRFDVNGLADYKRITNGIMLTGSGVMMVFGGISMAYASSGLAAAAGAGLITEGFVQSGLGLTKIIAGIFDEEISDDARIPSSTLGSVGLAVDEITDNENHTFEAVGDLVTSAATINNPFNAESASDFGKSIYSLIQFGLSVIEVVESLPDSSAQSAEIIVPTQTESGMIDWQKELIDHMLWKP